MSDLLLRMQHQPEFRRQRFVLAADALGACEDRVSMGFCHINREFADMVWRLSQASLPVAGAAGAQSGGVPPDGAGRSSLAADREAAFHAASASLRARQRLQCGDESREDGSQPPAPPRASN
jgi:hypothetical protein